MFLCTKSVKNKPGKYTLKYTQVFKFSDAELLFFSNGGY